MKIAVFGGSFDPPHKGHVIIADYVVSCFVNLLIFVPTYYPPHKNSVSFAPFDSRLKMIRLITEGKKSMIVSDIERHLNKKPSYIFYTMRALQERYINDELSLLIGSDSLLNLHTWYNAEEIVKNWNIITYRRPGYEVDLEELKKLWRREEFEKIAKGIILNSPLSNLSSSQIRY
ncbi:MAG TPA: nicotinate (nicotinamide) nucleotide adenylyltransferase, partial [Victivallales bacterium]|nr:nicotinate (nicotinamide) nucleotide adenylyltransferase [Victivallales bacterium]